MNWIVLKALNELFINQAVNSSTPLIQKPSDLSLSAPIGQSNKDILEFCVSRRPQIGNDTVAVPVELFLKGNAFEQVVKKPTVAQPWRKDKADERNRTVIIR